MITSSLGDIQSEQIFFKCNDFLSDKEIYIKLEGLNLAGSIKLKTAKYLLANLAAQYNLSSNKYKIIESSSGNLGVALSLLCKQYGYHFTCVTDPNISPLNEKYIELFGAELIKITQRDQSGGYLETRITYIESLIRQDPTYLWTNQYANPQNIHAHYCETGPEILKEMGKIDYLFIGAGTTGTVLGCAKFFKEHSKPTKIIAVDTVGSVTFNHPPAKRYIPGIGTSKRPPIVEESLLDDIIHVHEKDAIIMCHFLLKKYGLFLGGSSGSILHAVKEYHRYPQDKVKIVAISPDFGEKYINSVYNLSWYNSIFGELEIMA